METSRTTHPRAVLYYNPTRYDYAVTESELQQVEAGVRHTWKDPCLVSLSVCIATSLNAVAEYVGQTNFEVTASLFLNVVFGVVGLFSSFGFGLAWRKEFKLRADIIEKIRNKTPIVLDEMIFDVGLERHDEEMKALGPDQDAQESATREPRVTN